MSRILDIKKDPLPVFMVITDLLYSRPGEAPRAYRLGATLGTYEAILVDSLNGVAWIGTWESLVAQGHAQLMDRVLTQTQTAPKGVTCH